MRPERAALTGDRGLGSWLIHAGYRAVSTRDILLEEIKNACLNNASRVAELLVELRTRPRCSLRMLEKTCQPRRWCCRWIRPRSYFLVERRGVQAEGFLQLIAEVLWERFNTAEVCVDCGGHHPHGSLRGDAEPFRLSDGINTVLFNDLKPMPP